jgi:hypothetical protein
MPNVLADVIQGFAINGAIHYGELPSVDFEIVSVLEEVCNSLSLIRLPWEEKRNTHGMKRFHPQDGGAFLGV